SSKAERPGRQCKPRAPIELVEGIQGAVDGSLDADRPNDSYDPREAEPRARDGEIGRECADQPALDAEPSAVGGDQGVRGVDVEQLDRVCAEDVLPLGEDRSELGVETQAPALERQVEPERTSAGKRLV